jgi:hypothetical protein
MDNVPSIAGMIAVVIASASLPVVGSYLLDRHAHEGVDWFKRRRVRLHGQPAEATILSSSMLTGRLTGKNLSAYSLVYEVRPPGQPPFRSRAIEVMYFHEAHANRLDQGEIVSVRYDPSDKTTVLMRVDVDKAGRDREAARRAKEEALLKGQRLE